MPKRIVAYTMPIPRLSQRPRLSENTTGTIAAASMTWSTSRHARERACIIAQIANGVRIANAEPHALV